MKRNVQESTVIIVGAGPSGLSTAACLSRLSIPYLLLERHHCSASTWKHQTYDRLHLHLKKHHCQLPHMAFPPHYPDYIPKADFINYLDAYVAHFKITPLFGRLVESASFHEVAEKRVAGKPVVGKWVAGKRVARKWVAGKWVAGKWVAGEWVAGKRVAGKWVVGVRNFGSGEVEEYCARFLVVATGEASEPYVPEIEGVGGFPGKVIHSTRYRSGKEFEGSNVVVVGSGNSGMEIALDLANHGARTSIVVRSPVHILSKKMVELSLVLRKYIPHHMMDSIMTLLSKVVYGDITKYGMDRPKEGPFFLLDKIGKYPIVDVGTFEKIKSGQIQVLPIIKKIEGNMVQFENGKSHPFDAIVFCTGFKRSTHKWLKGGDDLLNEEGLSIQSNLKSYKGKNGLYCAGLARKGLFGIAADGLGISEDIKLTLMFG